MPNPLPDRHQRWWWLGRGLLKSGALLPS